LWRRLLQLRRPTWAILVAGRRVVAASPLWSLVLRRLVILWRLLKLLLLRILQLEVVVKLAKIVCHLVPRSWLPLRLGRRWWRHLSLRWWRPNHGRLQHHMVQDLAVGADRLRRQLHNLVHVHRFVLHLGLHFVHRLRDIGRGSRHIGGLGVLVPLRVRSLWHFVVALLLLITAALLAVVAIHFCLLLIVHRRLVDLSVLQVLRATLCRLH
jgi:hypothetical protein